MLRSVNLSKFERYKKKADTYIYPHKHCKTCGEMISEAYSYCTECYKKTKEKKKKKRRFKRNEKIQEEKDIKTDNPKLT